MVRLKWLAVLLPAFICVSFGHSESPSSEKNPREALKPFNNLIGNWKGTGIPYGTRSQAQKGFWIENQEWSWKFKGDDSWLEVNFDKGKYFLGGELRYLPKSKEFSLELKTKDNQMVTYKGKLQDKTLSLKRVDGPAKSRLVFRFLHSNRYLYRYDEIPADRNLYQRIYQVGVTKKGVPFVKGDGRPECIVSGGLGTTAVTYKGETYYVCCGGCRDEFYANPEQYVKIAKQKKN